MGHIQTPRTQKCHTDSEAPYFSMLLTLYLKPSCLMQPEPENGWLSSCEAKEALKTVYKQNIS